MAARRGSTAVALRRSRLALAKRAEATAAATRAWPCDGEVLAIGLLDGPGLVRLAVAPHRREDAALAHRLTADLDDPAGGVLAGDGGVTVEARGAELQRRCHGHLRLGRLHSVRRGD